jgi:hypothetical protein
MSSLLAYYFSRNLDSEVQFNRPFTPIELSKAIFKGIPDKRRQEIKTNDPNCARNSKTDLKEVLSNFEHDATLLMLNNINKKKYKEPKQEKKAQGIQQKGELYQLDTKGCKLCDFFEQVSHRLRAAPEKTISTQQGQE